MSHRLVILSGPSCVGKSPLVKALGQFHSHLRKALQPVVLYNSRDPRPGEKDGVDYHFRTADEIQTLGEKPKFVVLDVRGDTQALDLDELHRLLATSDALFEGNPFVGHLLLTHEKLREVPKLSLFVSPLSRAEIEYLQQQSSVSLPALVTDVMRRKLLRRTRKQKGDLSLRDLEEIERRAGSAYQELTLAPEFDHVVANHDGEDSDNWTSFYHPLGDARRTLLALAALLAGEPTDATESWPAGFLS